jgi:hypothetical protein
VSSPDPEICVYSIKWCTPLAENGKLPPPLFHGLLRQPFSYRPFDEVPFVADFLRLIRACPDFVERIGGDDSHFVITFSPDGFSNSQTISKVVSPVNGIFFAAPALLKLLPFSVVGAVAAHFDSLLSRLNAADDFREVTDVPARLTKFGHVADADGSERSVILESVTNSWDGRLARRDLLFRHSGLRLTVFCPNSFTTSETSRILRVSRLFA